MRQETWSRLKDDAPIALLYAFAALITTSICNWGASAFGWLAKVPKNGMSPLIASVTVPAWALGVSVLVFVVWLGIAVLRPKQLPSSSQRVTAQATTDEHDSKFRVFLLNMAQEELAKEKKRSDFLGVSLDEAKANLKQAEPNAQRWKSIAPLVAAYGKTMDVATRLESFKSSINRPYEATEARDMVGEFIEWTQQNTTAYNAEYRHDVVQHVAELKSKFGLMHPALTDQAVIREVITPETVKDMANGFKVLATEIGDMLLKQVRTSNDDVDGASVKH